MCMGKGWGAWVWRALCLRQAARGRAPAERSPVGTAGVGGRCDGQRGESVGVPGGGALLRKSDGWGRRRRGRRHVPAVTKRDRNWPIRRNSIFAQAQGACACLLDFTWSWRARACTPAQFAPFPAGTTTWGLCCKLE